jgi:hypothetical protein
MREVPPDYTLVRNGFLDGAVIHVSSTVIGLKCSDASSLCVSAVKCL